MSKYLIRTKKFWSFIIVFAMVLSSALPAEGLLFADTSDIQIQKSGGWLESAYVEWSDEGSADGYNVYYKPEAAPDSNYVKIDNMLIREYPDYFRADAVGLAEGSYVLRIVPIFGETEDTDKKAETVSLTVKAHTREGFVFTNRSTSGLGAYNDDGTLKGDAKVIYITPNNAGAVQLDVQTGSNGTITTCIGVNEILKAKQKGYDKTPLAMRFIGNVKASDMAGQLNSSGYIEVKGAGAYTELNITIEGIGEDATVNGWGILVRQAKNIEIRNLGIMLFPDDGISLDTKNSHVWIHNNDVFYGSAGGDADQAKGDGSLDLKGDTQYVTFSYNHLWDSGKASLCGMSSETGPNYITYHHNWFDHSDSRHPRVRTMSVHVYNNYFDGISKYGIGVTSGASIFAENNYFRNCKYPMMSSLQGTDIINGTANGTFSGEEGGMIKSYGNYIEGETRFVDQKSESVQFDAITVENRDDKVPGIYETVSGGHVYNNFDTDPSIMYSYTPDTSEDGKTNTMMYAGRVNGGDLKWEFDNSKDDTDYSVNAALMAKIRSYTSNIVSIGGNQAEAPAPTPTVTPGGGSGNGKIHNFTINGLTSDFYTITGSLSTSKGSTTYDGLTLTQCLKMESSTNIVFTTTEEAELVLVFDSGSSLKTKINDINYAASGGIITLTLSAGTHKIIKADSVNLFYIKLSYLSDETEEPTTVPTETPSPTGEPTAVPTQTPSPTGEPTTAPTEPSGSKYVYIADDKNVENTQNYFTIAGSTSSNGGTQTYGGKSLDKGLKFNSEGSITFNTDADGATLVIGVNANKAGSALKLNGNAAELSGIGTVFEEKTVTLDKAGTYKIEKGTNECYVYYVIIYVNDVGEPTPTAAPEPTIEPTAAPTAAPEPTIEPTAAPTAVPTPTVEPTTAPTAAPTPTVEPTAAPTAAPTPTVEPTAVPTLSPLPSVTSAPLPTASPSPIPTSKPNLLPSTNVTLVEGGNNTEAKAEVSEKEIIDFIASLSEDTNLADISLSLPSATDKDKEMKYQEIIIPAKVYESAKDAGKGLNFEIEMNNGQSYSWKFEKGRLTNSEAEFKDTNLLIEFVDLADPGDHEVKGIINNTQEGSQQDSNNGLLISFKHNGLLPSYAEVSIPVTKNLKGERINTGTKVYLYYVNNITGKLEELPVNEYIVDENGYINIHIAHCSDYVILPEAAALDTVDRLMDRIIVNEEDVTLYASDSSNVTGDTSFNIGTVIPLSLRNVSKLNMGSKFRAEEVLIVYRSNNPGIASVSNNGIMTANKKGKAVITVTVILGNMERKKVQINVDVK